MALKTVTGKVTNSSTGTGGIVIITLSQSAVITGTQEVVNSSVQPIVAADGTYSVQLQANNDLTPSGTYYTVEEIGPGGGTPVPFTVIVPSTAGPFVMSSIAAVAPAALLGGTNATINPAGDIAGRSFSAQATGPYVASSDPGTIHGVFKSPKPSGDVTGATDGPALQALIDLATALPTGGTVELQRGRYWGTLILKPNVRLVGAGMLQTYITTPAGSSADTIQGFNFLTLTGKQYAALDYTRGARNVELRDLCVDGNRANVTAGYCFRTWGDFIHMHNVEFRNGHDGNLWTEFTDDDDFTDSLQQLSLQASNIQLQNSGGHGWVDRGPHDGVVIGLLSWNHVGTTLRSEDAKTTVAAVTAATTVGTIATFTTAVQTYVVGQQVTVTGVTPAGYNGTWRVLTASNPTNPFGQFTQFTADIGTTPGALSIAGTATGVASFKGALTVYYANSFLCSGGSYYTNGCLRLYGGQATAGNIAPGIIFDGGSGDCRASGVLVAGHQPGMILRGANHQVSITGIGNFGDLVQIDGLGWSSVDIVGSGNANVVNVISENGPNTIKARVNPPAAGATKNVTAATTTGTIATFSVTAHGFVVGQLVTVAGVTPAGYNGTWLILTVATNTFTADIGTTPGALSIAGTVQTPAGTIKRGAAFSQFTAADLVANGGAPTTQLLQLSSSTLVNPNGWSPQLPADNGIMVTRTSTDNLTNKTLNRKVSSPAYNANLTPDANAFDTYAMAALTGAVTVNAANNIGFGTRLKFIWTQDGVGGRVVTYAAPYKTTGAVAVSTAASTVTIDEFESWDATVWRLCSRITGQAI